MGNTLRNQSGSLQDNWKVEDQTPIRMKHIPIKIVHMSQYESIFKPNASYGLIEILG